MNKEKKFDCIKFKTDLHIKLLQKSKAKNISEYVKYINDVAKKSSFHKIKE